MKSISLIVFTISILSIDYIGHEQAKTFMIYFIEGSSTLISSIIKLNFKIKALLSNKV